VAMWRNATRRPAAAPANAPPPRAPGFDRARLPLLAAQAIAIGMLTAIIGAGGGFLIVPVLVVLAKLDMRQAVGTSLLVITMNALSGLAGYIGQVPIQWRLVVPFTLIAIAGALVGTRLTRYIPQQRLKQTFAVVVMLVAVYVIYKRY